MLRDVNTKITDGGFGSVDGSGVGAHVKIGASPVSMPSPIIISSSMGYKKIKEKLGLSPLADACMDSIENGSSLIYCIPVIPSIKGVVVNIDKGNVTGLGSCTVLGEPNNAYDLLFEITASGGLNEAAFKYSVDGGFSYSEEMTMPISGEVSILNTGVIFKFTENVVKKDSFKVNDVYRVITSAPKLSNQQVIEALESIRNFQYEYEFIHVVGESEKALWAAVSTEIEVLSQKYKKPAMVIFESRNIRSDETLDDYCKSLTEEKKGLQNFDIQVVTARSIYTRMDHTVKDINNAGIVCGLYSKTKIQDSIGEVAKVWIPENKMIELRPKGIEDYIGILDNAKYLTFRKYQGKLGFFVTNARMMCPDGSDYKYAELVRVKNKIYRETRKQALEQIQSNIDLSDLEGSLNTMAKFIQVPLEEMARNGEISSGRVEISNGENLLTEEKLNARVRYVPRGYIREIELDIGMENPFR